MDPTTITRIIPLILAGGGAAVAIGSGRDTANRVLDTVKTVISRYEMSNIQTAMQAEIVSGGGLPDLEYEEDVSEFIRGVVQGKFGRDAAMDLWGNPYLIEEVSNTEILLVSTGPNGLRDSCSNYSQDEAEVGEIMDMADENQRRRQDAYDEMEEDGTMPEIDDAFAGYGQGYDPADFQDDDVCLSMEVSSGRGAFQRL
jgi:hypothetical protein